MTELEIKFMMSTNMSMVNGLLPKPMRHREEPEGRRGDLIISITYGRLLRRFTPRNDRKSHLGNRP